MVKPSRTSDTDFEKQNELAIRAAREADRIEPRANAAAYDPTRGMLIVELRGGFAFGFPPERIPELANTTASRLAKVRISPSGDGLHWDDLDVQVSLTGLMAEALNLREWAPRIMGQTRSEAKSRASRINGLKGGRPRQAPKPTRRAKKPV
jgi:hypothetical protein